jgi:hypothetical protein
VGLRDWLKGFFERPPEPEEPAACIAFHIGRLGEKARHEVEGLRALARDNFGEAAVADRWFLEPVPFLGGKRPIDAIATRSGRAAVGATLYNLRHGIYS